MSKRKKNKKNKQVNVEIENNAVEEAVSEDVETVANETVEEYDDMTMLVNDTEEVEEAVEDNGPVTELVDDEPESAEEATEEVTEEVEEAINESEEEIVAETEEPAAEMEEAAEPEEAEEPAGEEVEPAADEAEENYDDMTILADEPEAEEAEEPVEEAVEEPEEPVSEDAAEEVVKEEPAAAAVPKKEAAALVKTPTPGISVAFYVIGLVFLVISLFMLFTAISYTKMYLESYDATFADMWSNSIQYVLEHFIPYVGFGIISIGLGKAIKEFRAGRAPNVDKLVNELKTAREDVSGSFQSSAETVNAAVESINVAAEAVKAMAQPAAEPEPVKEAPVEAEQDEQAKENDETNFKIFELSKNIEALMEVMNIKFEETEKRQKYRLDEKLEENKQFLADELASLKEARAEKEDALFAEVARIADRFNMDYDLDDDDDMDDDDDVFEKRERHFIK